MTKKFYILSTILTLCLCTNIKEMSAQINVDKSGFTGKGSTLESLIPGTTGKAEKLLLYNVGKDMFLNAGGFWGTRTTTFTVGLPITLEKQSNGSYVMKGPFNNISGAEDVGNCIGRLDYKTGDDAYKQNGVFYDRAENGKSGTHWTFEKVADNDGDATYYIKCEKKYNLDNKSTSVLKNDYYLVGNQTMTIEVFKGGNNNLVKCLTESEKSAFDDKYAQWKIVTENEMIKQFDTTYDKENPSDATFLLRAQNFNRTNMYNNADGTSTKESLGWQKSGSFTYEVGTDVKPGSGQTDESHGDGKYGMFYCGGIKDAKKGAKLYQTVAIRQSGWYRVDCQGFFYNETDNDKCYARLYAKDITNKGTADNTASSAYVNMLPKSYGEPFHALELISGQPAIVEDGIVTNKIEAAVVFYAQTYPNSLLLYINFDETAEKERTIELGIEITEDMGKGDFTYFDDFQLKYLGESFALDEDWTNTDIYTQDAATYKNRVLVLKRSLKANKWNGFTLPVSLTKQQLNTAFFPNPRLAVLTDMSSPYTISFKLVDLKTYKDDAIVIEAGKNYIINPGYEGREGMVKVGNKDQTEVTGPYYTIDRVSFTPSAVNADYATKHASTDESGFSYPGKECKLTMYGTYIKQAAPKHSYILYGGDMYHLTSDYRQKGFNCWIEDEHQMTNPAERHRMSFTAYMDGVSDDTTTDITEMLVYGGSSEDGTVYNIQGQAVSKCGIDGKPLPKGIYIRNGKKIIIK